MDDKGRQTMWEFFLGMAAGVALIVFGPSAACKARDKFLEWLDDGPRGPTRPA